MNCEKETYGTYQLALAALKGLIKRGIKKLKAYKCKDCNYYHLASVNEHTKSIGYRPQNGGKVMKKKVKKNFKPIKVTQEEIEEGRKYKTPKAGIFFKYKKPIKNEL